MDPLDTLHEIRQLMERTTRFTSLSGRAGMGVGVCALVGMAVLGWHFRSHHLSYTQFMQGELPAASVRWVVGVMSGVFICAVASTFYFTFRNAQGTGQSLWQRQGQRFWLSLALPLTIGGAFCGALVYHGLFALLAPASLLFYGLALLHSSRYTFRGIRYLGWGEVLLGLASCFWIEQAPWCWTLGFGVLHILYGGTLFYTTERAQLGRETGHGNLYLS
ncbi:hypothetical protein SAMN05421823_11818 [Catalinimonas alkaloidigena]|uniref:Uncharacterized protein n=1 Tax=Catalinimonas alkaloidigena TaxID=1075417 RepID=A0A1G9UWK5_9BACT|nr:hypothetical protein [Catalinimonas alkaloidigena]SDM64313.1 hypothetical protein SAMN05421823_11818 [Catalinimonas alkaloidigena]